MMARVRGVMRASIAEASMLQVSGSTSTNTGLAPSSTIISAVAAKVKGVVMTSSPGPMSSAISAISSASVPLATVMQWRAPTKRGEPRLELLDLGAHDVLAVVEHALDAGMDAVLQRRVLRLQVGEGQRRPEGFGRVHAGVLGLAWARRLTRSPRSWYRSPVCGQTASAWPRSGKSRRSPKRLIQPTWRAGTPTHQARSRARRG